MIKFLLILFFCAVQFSSFIGKTTVYPLSKAPIPALQKKWVDSVFNTLTLDQKIGQLFMIRAHSDKGPEHIAAVENQIKKYHVGGLCFFQGTPLKQAELTNNYQALSKIPMMVAMDAETGLGMRFKDAAITFPKALTLGAIKDNKLIYEMGAEIAKELKRIGVHINFAPVVDINVNAANPVINDRSFGENKSHVTAKAFQYMKGMQDQGLMACAKHFPGHGDTDVDSHHDLPMINHSRTRLDSMELFPFKVLFENGIQSVMVAHLQVPSIEADTKTPTSLSHATMNQLIKSDLEYEGLIFSDALEMKGVTKNYASGELETVAFKAGCDILCLPNSIDSSFLVLKQYVSTDPKGMSRLNTTVKQILYAKYKMGLHDYAPASFSNLISDVNNKKAIALKTKLYEQAITLVKNKNNLIPITEIGSSSIGSLSIGSSSKTPLQWRMDSYAKVQHFQTGNVIADANAATLLNTLKAKNIVVISLHSMSRNASQNYGITASAHDFIQKLSKLTKVIVVSFGNAYALKNFTTNDWVIQAYEEDGIMQDLVAQALFGSIGMNGKLPITASPEYISGTGLQSESLMKFGYSIPERVNINSLKLSTLDVLSQQIMSDRAAPGGQILVARHGKIVYHKAFGYMDYDMKNPVGLADMYDLASITKIAASTLSVMKLYEEGKITIDQPIGNYLPEIAKTNKAGLTLSEIMSHQAGLIAWIPFYKETLQRVRRNIYKPDPKFYSSKASASHSLPVANGMFLKSGYDDLIWETIKQSEMRNSKRYLYSDLGFYMIAHMIKHQTGLSIDEYAHKTFYEPLGLEHTLYNPYKKFSTVLVAPTEQDKYWRQRKVQGYVHDMGAAMLNGVSGHAGLFSNSLELGTIMQLLLNGGIYNGKRFLQKSTIDLFASRQLGSTRRGIGFDMKELDPTRPQPAGYLASTSTFGHTGFTGTAAWVDPENELVFIFLCNRTYPSMNNNTLHKREYRSKLLDAVYLALEDKNFNEPIYVEPADN